MILNLTKKISPTEYIKLKKHPYARKLIKDYQLEFGLARENAIKTTLRKIGCFGDNRRSIDFEWPTEDDLRQMPKNHRIKLTEIKF